MDQHSNDDPNEHPSDPRTATHWLAHLESQLGRLHAKWQDIDAEFKKHEAHIDVLHREVERHEQAVAERDAKIARLMHELASARDRVARLEAELREEQETAERLERSVDGVTHLGATKRTHGTAVCKLVATIGGQAVHYPLLKHFMTIGRGQNADIRIPSHFVSRLHAKIRTSEGAIVIEDAGSKNGTLVNAKRVHRRVLRHGDIVTLGGDLTLRFVDATR